MCVCLQWCTHNGQTLFLSGVYKLTVLYSMPLRGNFSTYDNYDNATSQKTSRRGRRTVKRNCVFCGYVCGSGVDMCKFIIELSRCRCAACAF